MSLPASTALACPPLSEGVALRVLTLNVWGLPLALHRQSVHIERIDRLARLLDCSNYDVVLLQEVWSHDVLHRLPISRFPYQATGPRAGSLLGGSGLVTISRYPISHVFFKPFQARGGFERAIRKGVLQSTVQVGETEIDLFNLHLISEPEFGSHLWLNDTETRRIRRAQMSEVTEFIRHSSPASRVKVIGGDFNVDDDHPEAFALRGSFGIDLFAHRSNEGLRSETGRVTFAPGTNPYSRSAHNTPERLDYLFVSAGDAILQRWSCRRVFTDEVVSDHFGVMSEFNVSSWRM